MTSKVELPRWLHEAMKADVVTWREAKQLVEALADSLPGEMVELPLELESACQRRLLWELRSPSPLLH